MNISLLLNFILGIITLTCSGGWFIYYKQKKCIKKVEAEDQQFNFYVKKIDDLEKRLILAIENQNELERKINYYKKLCNQLDAKLKNYEKKYNIVC
jgi:septal ring factor EnvC (AmiA/AmiB activator)